MGASLSAATTYRLHQRVGRGGMGAVHLGTMIGPAGERRVAIKQLVADANRSGGIDEEARQRLLDEARLVFQLTHANICQVFDVASNADGTFVVMELVDGLDLRALVSRAGPLHLSHALYVGREVARALDYAHRRADTAGRPLLLVHGDVTPANVLVSREGEVKLADFGIARALGGAPSTSLRIAGTPGFLAPELRSHGTSQRADLYALGITLYIALTGRSPGTDDFDPRALRRVRPDASPELERLIAHATAPDPRARIASAAQLEQGLAVELARRFAEFTPSSLARVVVEHHQGLATPNPDEVTLVLESATSVVTPAVRMGPEPASRGDSAAPREQAPGPGTATAPPMRSRSRAPWLVGPALVLAVAGIVALQLREDGTPRAPVAPAPTVASADVATPTSPPVPTEVAVGSSAPTTPATPPRRRNDAPRPTRPAAAPSRGTPARTPERETTAASGFLTVTARNWGAVYLDDRRVAAQTPLYKLAVPSGRHQIKLFHPTSGEYSAVQDIEVRPGEVAQVSFK